jgi:hypothetical protein
VLIGPKHGLDAAVIELPGGEVAQRYKQKMG